MSARRRRMAPAYAVLAMLALAGVGSSACAFLAPFPDAAPDPEVDPGYIRGQAFGDANEQRGTGVATSVDAVVLTGHVVGQIDLGGGLLQEDDADGSPDAFLAAFTPDGAHRWSKRFSNAMPRGVAIATGGDIVIAGGAAGDVDFGGGVYEGSGGNEDIVIARLDAQGGHVWTMRYGGGGPQFATAVAVDAWGNSLVTGSCRGSSCFDDVHAIKGKTDGFIAKLDPEGATLWSKSFGDSGNQQVASSVAVDGDGNVLLTGWFKGELDLGGTVIESMGETDAFAAKLTPEGDLLWARALGSTSAAKGLGVAVDGAGNAFVTGSFRSSIQIGDVLHTTQGDKSVFLAKLDDNGLPLWSRSFGDAGDQEGASVATDLAGNVLLTGWFLGSMDLDADTLTANGAADGFVAKLDPTGSALWARSFGDEREQVGTAVSADSAGHVWVTGYFAGSVDFGGTPLPSSGANDVFLVELEP